MRLNATLLSKLCLIRDRCRTTINVWGDSVGAAIVEKLTQKHLMAMEQKQLEDVEDQRSTPPPNYTKAYPTAGPIALYPTAIDSTYL